MTLPVGSVSGGRLTPTAVYDSYWRFAAERQAVYFARLEDRYEPWTDDAVLRSHKFTNTYRAADRVSQYLIRRVIYDGDASPAPVEVIFRVLLFKFFNRIETWQALTDALGTPSWQSFDPERYGNVLVKLRNAGHRIYSAAYIIPPVPPGQGRPKHIGHLALLEYMMSGGFADQARQCGSLQDLYRLLLSYPSLGPFLAFQLAIDINYSEAVDFDEGGFVVAGPGARDGIAKCFVDHSMMAPEDIIGLMVERQNEEFDRLGIAFRNLFGRRLQPIDCQNLFCEISKYARVTHPHVAGVSNRTRIKQKFRPTGPLPAPFFPPKWGINANVPTRLQAINRMR